MDQLLWAFLQISAVSNVLQLEQEVGEMGYPEIQETETTAAPCTLLVGFCCQATAWLVPALEVVGSQTGDWDNRSRMSREAHVRICERLGHLLPRSTRLMISIPPKYAVSQVVGFIKGKSAIHIARVYAGRKQNFVGQHFWARGYFASTVGRDEQVIRNYIRHQEEEDRRVDQMKLM